MGHHLATTLSVIIPTLNEASSITSCLDAIAANQNLEIIIADGGSTDDTRAIAKKHPAVRWLDSTRGRARQMNHAAATAHGDVLLFLHADTILPPGAIDSILDAIKNGCSTGCFERTFRGDHWLLRHTSRWAGWRARRFFLAFGDQAIFIKSDLFSRLGGFRELQEFEDMDLTRRARRHGKWCVLQPPIVTDARRFHPSPYKRIISDASKTALWLLRQKK